ncbi:MAG: SIMPL domain-containing protein [Acidisphaera sp.]|nr:SIMPL domain-containing protein [Acidisphaera sp.]
MSSSPDRMRAALGLAVVFATASAAGAQTTLHLTASASVPTAPDQLVADLLASATTPTAADAQRRVNASMTSALDIARGTPSVEARAIGYEVTPIDDKRTGWTAQQTLELRGGDGPSVLDLAGKLQAQGMAIASLDWRLTPDLRRHAQDEATTQALKAMQAQAASAAATLGLHVDHLADVRIQPNEPFLPRPLMAGGAMRAAAMPLPEATASPQDVTVAVAADVVLRP